MNWSKHVVISLICVSGLVACASDTSVPTSTSASPSRNAVGSPPPPRAENVPPAPNRAWYWSPGFWQFEGNRYVWKQGNWVEPRPSQVYVNPYWTVENGVSVFHEGRWVNVQETPQNVAVLTTTMPVPESQQEPIPAAPGNDYFWVPGQYRLISGNYVWNSGHWERYRTGQVWVAERWIPNGRGEWKYVGGYWQNVQ